MYTCNGAIFAYNMCVLFTQVGDRLLAVNGKLVTNGHECIYIYTYIYTYIHTYIHTYMYIYNGGMYAICWFSF